MTVTGLFPSVRLHRVREWDRQDHVPAVVRGLEGLVEVFAERSTARHFLRDHLLHTHKALFAYGFDIDDVVTSERWKHAVPGQMVDVAERHGSFLPVQPACSMPIPQTGAAASHVSQAMTSA